MSLGEPQHAPPSLVGETLAENADNWGRYPPLRGTPSFRHAVADWLDARYHLPEGFIDADENILPVAGSREAIFMFGLVAVPYPTDPGDGRPNVLVPNPLYHVYAGAGVMAGAQPVFVPATSGSGFLPDFSALDEATLDQTVLAYLCSPANPKGGV